MWFLSPVTLASPQSQRIGDVIMKGLGISTKSSAELHSPSRSRPLFTNSSSTTLFATSPGVSSLNHTASTPSEVSPTAGISLATGISSSASISITPNGRVSLSTGVTFNTTSRGPFVNSTNTTSCRMDLNRPSTGSGASYASACFSAQECYNSAFQAWLSSSPPEVTSTTTISSTITVYTGKTATCPGAFGPTTTRIVGTLTSLGTTVLASASKILNDGQPIQPSCSISVQDCKPSWTDVCAPPPATCGACTIKPQTVRLLYFPPPANVTAPVCRDNTDTSTACPLGPTTAPLSINTGLGLSEVPCQYATNFSTSTMDSGPSAVVNGSTFFQNRAYIEIDAISAVNECGPIGAIHTSAIITLMSSDVHSFRGNNEAATDIGYSFDFRDLTNVPPEVYRIGFFIPPNEYDTAIVNGVSYGLGNNSLRSFDSETIYDPAYAPTLLMPLQVRSLDAAWASCSLDLAGFYDPPLPLTTAAVLDTPTPKPPNPGSTPQPVSAPPTALPASTSSQPKPTQGGGGSGSNTGGSGGSGSSGSGSSGSGSSGSGSGSSGSGSGSSGSGSSGSSSSGSGSSGSGSSGSGSGSSGGGSSGSGSGSSGSGSGSSGSGSSGSSSSGSGTSGSGSSGAGTSGGSGSNSGSSSGGDSGANSGGAGSSSGGSSNNSGGSGSSGSPGAGSSGSGGNPGASSSSGSSSGSSGDNGNPASSGTSGSSNSGGNSGSSGNAGGGGAGTGSGSDSGSGSSSGSENSDGSGGGAAGSGNDQSPEPVPSSIGGQPVSADPSNPFGVVIGSNTLTPGQSTVIGSTPVAVGTGVIVVGGSGAGGGNGDGNPPVSGGGQGGSGSAGTAAGGGNADSGNSGDVGGSGNQAVQGTRPATIAIPPAGGSGNNVGVGVPVGNGQTLTASQVAGGVAIGSTTLADGQVASFGGSRVSVSGDNIVVTPEQPTAGAVGNNGNGGVATTFALFNAPALASAIGGGAAAGATSAVSEAPVTLNGKTLTAIESGNAVVLGSLTLTVGGSAQTLGNGQVVSAASGAVVIDGSTIPLSAAPLAAEATFALGSQAITATEAGSTIVFGSATLTIGGAATTIDGHVVSAGRSGLVVDRTSTVPFSAAPTEEATFDLGSQAVTAVEAGNKVVIDSTTLTVGGAARTIDRHRISAGNGDVVVDGTRTIQLSARQPHPLRQGTYGQIGGWG
ncbi:hypothetical protein NA57DRAFT_81329 [Rhizodiscina lignyota]|uniref:Uncharacterized protein n=1 Tax=Rhizodiscina lignyota TaxID=1504668 RepID=A0A9P4M099_9PEZI|nr:hypothetical protein NA57DRAFT_81329 [Rhizodiscina lignyota]